MVEDLSLAPQFASLPETNIFPWKSLVSRSVASSHDLYDTIPKRSSLMCFEIDESPLPVVSFPNHGNLRYPPHKAT